MTWLYVLSALVLGLMVGYVMGWVSGALDFMIDTDKEEV